MGLEQRLQQRIRPSKVADDDFEEFSDHTEFEADKQRADSDEQDSEESDGSQAPLANDDADSHDGSQSENVSEDDQEAPTEPDTAFADISFGALASAQASLNPTTSLKRKRCGPSDPSARKRSRSPSPFHEAEERRAGKKLDSKRSSHARSSKHAPTETSSKKAVSRKRSVVDGPAKPAPRDPRFQSLSGNLDENIVARKYAFLDDYRASEMSDLKTKIRAEKHEGRKEGLRKQLRAMEDRERARERVEEERRVIREHRKGEREAVAEGKKAYFLKASEVKKQVLQKKFEGMSEKKAERVMEKRRKKKASKERKNMPDARRSEM